MANLDYDIILRDVKNQQALNKMGINQSALGFKVKYLVAYRSPRINQTLTLICESLSKAVRLQKDFADEGARIIKVED